jgi:L-fuculose-phosphate aldolase
MAQREDRESELRRLICEIGRRIYNKSYTSGTGGNISARLDDARVLITPSRRNKGFLKPDEIVLIDMEGKSITEGITASSERLVHLQFYRTLPDAGAVIHAHPPAATAYALAGLEIDCSYCPETMVFLGDRVPLVPYETPSTQALPDSFTPYLNSKTTAYLMQNHGVVTIGADLTVAYNNLETLELYAKTLLYARIIGEPKPIPPDKTDHLKETFGL